MKRPSWQALSGYVAAAGFLALAVGWIASGPVGGDAVPEVQKPAAQLTETGKARPAVRVRTQDADWHRRTLTAQGRTAADRRIVVRAEASGNLINLPVDKGARVAEGDRIARIDAQDKPARLKEAEALLAQRRTERDGAEKLAEKGFRGEQQLAQARALFEQAQAQVKQAQVALAQTRVRAAFDGIVAARPVDVGDYVAPGDKIAELIDLDPLVIVASVTERNVDRIELGQPVSATTLDGRTLKGTVTYIASEADETTRTFTIEAEVPNPDATLRAGMTVDMTIPVQAERAHFIAPSILTLADDGTVGVKILDESDTVRFEPVTIQADTPEGVWVTGLPKRVTLITVGQNFVETGQKVRARTEAEIARSLPETSVSLPADMPGDPGPEAQP